MFWCKSPTFFYHFRPTIGRIVGSFSFQNSFCRLGWLSQIGAHNQSLKDLVERVWSVVRFQVISPGPFFAPICKPFRFPGLFPGTRRRDLSNNLIFQIFSSVSPFRDFATFFFLFRAFIPGGLWFDFTTILFPRFFYPRTSFLPSHHLWLILKYRPTNKCLKSRQKTKCRKQNKQKYQQEDTKR